MDALQTRWTVDPAEDLPLAIIEDTEDGLGVVEFGVMVGDEFYAGRLAVAEHIIRLHNASLEVSNG